MISAKVSKSNIIIFFWYGLAFIVNENGKTRFTSWGKLMREFKFYNWLDTGIKSKKKPIYESRKMTLNQAQN